MAGPRTTGVFISANAATMVRWSPELTVRHRVDSAIPGRHRSTGRPPTEDHGGAGRRDEHMRSFFEQVDRSISPEDDLLLVGDGEVVEHFADHLRAEDAKHGHRRRMTVETSGPLTQRQLVARIRAFAGSPAKRLLPR